MLTCSEVLERHSEYLDGEMPKADAARWREHLAICASCARYDRVLRNGLKLFSALPHTEPDSDFTTYIKFRIAEEQRRSTSRSFSTYANFSSVAAVLALAALLPVLLMVHLPATPSSASHRANDIHVTANEIAWHGEMVDEPSHDSLERPVASLEAPNPGAAVIDKGYTPLILESPTAPPSYSLATFTIFETR